MDIVYESGTEELVDKIKPHWEALAAHHLTKSVYFREHFAKADYAPRKAKFLKKAALGKLRIDIARDEASGVVAGYCVCSFDDEQTGEIDSLFVYPEYRRQGVGEQLMQRGLSWLDELGTVKKILDVAYGNEQVFRFYEKFGFYPRRVNMEQKLETERI